MTKLTTSLNFIDFSFIKICINNMIKMWELVDIGTLILKADITQFFVATPEVMWSEYKTVLFSKPNYIHRQ